MNKRKAIAECKALWKEIEKSGLGKYEFLGSPAGQKWGMKEYQDNCPLCEYVNNNGGCNVCPLTTQYNKGCTELKFSQAPDDPKFFEAVRGLK